ncbi:hypothetical protein HZF02_10080 [Pseudomonas yamanorum]|nr:hypothetical protein HZF02_10080 [Pseudomonas yamanorum]
MPESDSNAAPSKKPTNWPATMLEMTGIIERCIDKEMEEDASPKHLAKSAVLAVCRVMGGSAVYIPYGVAVEKMLMHESLYKDHLDGMEHKELIKKYKTTSNTVYKIISEAQRHGS